MATQKVNIKIEDEKMVEGQAPVIVSASRSTDIPAFYCDWFFARLNHGYSVWTNPFNGKKSYISYESTRFIVFWSKNPRPLLPYLDYLEEKGIGYYIQYTLNDYEKEGLEPGVPCLKERIDTFKDFVKKIGRGRVVWRFDPLILTNEIGIDDLLDKVKKIGDELRDYTEKLVFSFADISSYKKVKNNLDKSGIQYREWDKEKMTEFARKLSFMNKVRGWHFQLATCAEEVDIDNFGISHNRCIDEDLIIRFQHGEDEKLMKYLGIEKRPQSLQIGDMFEMKKEEPEGIVKNGYIYIKNKGNKDKGQRAYCGCIVSKDIGQYNTCPHQCEYCYANTSKTSAVMNWQRHLQNPQGPTITG